MQMPTAERPASGGLQGDVLSLTKGCPRCGGKVAREGEEYICLICSTRFDLRPLRKEGPIYRPEERQRALALAHRIGGAAAARLLGIPAASLYSFGYRPGEAPYPFLLGDPARGRGKERRLKPG